MPMHSYLQSSGRASPQWPQAKLTICLQVFLLLVAEMTLFMVLIIPLPFTVRRKLFTYVNKTTPSPPPQAPAVTQN